MNCHDSRQCVLKRCSLKLSPSASLTIFITFMLCAMLPSHTYRSRMYVKVDLSKGCGFGAGTSIESWEYVVRRLYHVPEPRHDSIEVASHLAPLKHQIHVVNDERLTKTQGTEECYANLFRLHITRFVCHEKVGVSIPIKCAHEKQERRTQKRVSE